MILYDYKTVAAPRRAGKFRGVAKGPDAFARTLEEAIAAEAAAGWEYLRAENLPCEERPGFLARRATVFHSVLIFRRPKPGQEAPTYVGGAGYAPGGFAEDEPPAFRRAPAPAPAQPASPDAGMMRLDPAMRQPAAAAPEAPAPESRLGPAER
ncbi:MAG: DUF4177 domain-containing protein [Pseudomonadota bacterium]|nr:DUF4177 domain-containing protein [Pseudomonadota bacterium]